MFSHLTRRAIQPSYRLIVASTARSSSALATLPKACSSCHQPLTSSVPACNKCGTIKPIPNDVDCYTLLGIPYEPEEFIIDEVDLRNRFRCAQVACHPDTWTARGEASKDVARELSSRVNNAYQTLRNPLMRLQYLLELNSVPMEETDKIDDMEFLSEVLMARDAIDEAENIEEVDVVIEETNAKMKQIMKEVAELVSNGDWTAAKAAAVRMKYIDGVKKAADAWKRDR